MKISRREGLEPSDLESGIRSDTSSGLERLTTTSEDYEIDDGSGENEDDIYQFDWHSHRYAPLFGRWNFHRRIPFLRTLWRYRFYRHNGFIELDYPLHRVVVATGAAWHAARNIKRILRNMDSVFAAVSY
jgi:hypothetical protein